MLAPFPSPNPSHYFPGLRLEKNGDSRSRSQTELTKETATSVFLLFGNVAFVFADSNTNNIGND